MHTYASRLMSERDHLTEMATDTAERAAAEDRDLTETEQASIDGWQKRCAEIDAQLIHTREQMESTRAWATLRQQLGQLDSPPAEGGNGNGNGGGRRSPGQSIEVRSWGDTFVESDAFRSWHGGRGAPVEMPYGLLERAAADPITTSDLPIQAATWAPREPTWRTPLLDAVGREPVGSNSVEWIRVQPDRPPAVPPTAEGALKPPLDVHFEEKSVTLETYAVWKPITRQGLEDYPRIRAIVEDYLREALRRSFASAVAAAIVADPDIPTVGTAATPLIASIRAAIAQVAVNGYSANALVVNPIDWAAMDVAAMILASILPGVQRGYWGLVVADDPGIPEGTAYVGDLAAAVTLFDRNRTAVYVTDSHADNFLRNILVILAETRGYAAVTAPTAMCKATGDPAACLECAPAGDGDDVEPAAATRRVRMPRLNQVLTGEQTTVTTTTRTTTTEETPPPSGGRTRR